MEQKPNLVKSKFIHIPKRVLGYIVMYREVLRQENELQNLVLGICELSLKMEH